MNLKKQVIDDYLANRNNIPYRQIGEKHGITPQTILTRIHDRKNNTNRLS